MKKILGLLVLLFVILLGVLIAQNYVKNKKFILEKTPTATINSHTFKLRVAKTAKEKQMGLSGDKSLPQDSGMLFPFEKPDYYSFWMKNMNFPIDIIFIKESSIVTVYESAQPPQTPAENIPVYQPKSPADTVLEINAGLSSKYNFKEGNRVKLESIN